MAYKVIYTLMSMALTLALAGIYLALPFVISVGWFQWGERNRPSTVTSMLSLVGFTLATLSGVFAISALFYNGIVGGGPFNNPVLTTMISWGLMLSILAFCASFGGIWRPNLLRWHAAFSSLMMLLFWSMAVMSF